MTPSGRPCEPGVDVARNPTTLPPEEHALLPTDEDVAALAGIFALLQRARRSPTYGQAWYHRVGLN
jgi:hypothetical protein